MVNFSFLSLLSAVTSIFAISLVLNIFHKVYQEDYKKPWLYIGVSTILLGSSQLLQFLNTSFNTMIINNAITYATIYTLNFISIITLTYAVLLEYLILKYYKGKFVKMKFVPVQEKTQETELDLSVVNGKSYFTFKKNKNFLLEQFRAATQQGYEGFLITEENPQEIRKTFKIEKTPIAWITQIDSTLDSKYLKDSLDSNSDIINPFELNNLISYIDNFLEQAQTPIILIELNLLLRTNNYTIMIEFLKYISKKCEKYDGITIFTINIDILKTDQLQELETFLNKLE